jgi:hypothetical protein
MNITTVLDPTRSAEYMSFCYWPGSKYEVQIGVQTLYG